MEEERPTSSSEGGFNLTKHVEARDKLCTLY